MDIHIPEHLLKCPVCFEIPGKEVYQCREGHVICSRCYLYVKDCPQCRSSFGREPIRNRYVEVVLDQAKFDCQHKDVGCGEVLSRGDLANHNKNCNYGKRYLTLCSKIGYKCHFEWNMTVLEKALTHATSQHGVIQCAGGTANLIKLKDFRNVVSASMSFDSMWTPVVFKFVEPPETNNAEERVFILLNVANSEDESISFALLQLEDPVVAPENSKFEVEFEIKNDNIHAPNLRWKQEPIAFKHADFALQVLPFRIPMKLLKKHFLNEGALHLKVSLRKRGDEVVLGSAESVETTITNVPLNVSRRTESVNDESDVMVWDGFTCDGCLRVPITGVRYKCLECPNYDLCGGCKKLKVHSQHVFACIEDEDHVGFVDFFTQLIVRFVGSQPPEEEVGRRMEIDAITEDEDEVEDAETGAGEDQISGERVEVEEVERPAPMEVASNNEVATIPDVVFHGVSCDECHTTVTGTRYKCLQCRNFDLCHQCISEQKHAHHVFVIIKNFAAQDFIRRVGRAYNGWVTILDRDTAPVPPPPENDDTRDGVLTTFDNVTCDGCRTRPLTGVRYKCLQCRSFDLCKTCADSRIHSHHLFTVIYTMAQNAFITSESNLRSPVPILNSTERFS